jgi:uncharacterized protein
MNRFDLTALFLLGFFGTGHCAGMCGPLIVAFPGAAGRISSHFFYHFGRMITYTAVGAFIGAFGAGLSFLAGESDLAPLPSVARIQVVFSMAAALFMLAFGLFRLHLLPEPAWMSIASPLKIPGFRSILRAAADRRSDSHMFLLGMMLGFLPCGLSYAAFARALPSGGALAGGALAAAFALGTFPGLLLLGTCATRISASRRRIMDVVSGIIMIGMAASLWVHALQATLG